MKSLSRGRGRLFATPWTVTHQAPLSMGFSRQEYRNGLPFPPLGDLVDLGIKLCLLHWQVDSFPLSHQFSSVQSLSHVRLCDPMNCSTPGLLVHHQLPEFTQTHIHYELVMPSNHLIHCRPLLLLPSIPPKIRVFSNESTVHKWWPKYWSFSFSISLPMNI